MAIIQNVCKLMNQHFDKENVYQVGENGRMTLMRGADGKYVRMIPAHVIYKGKPTEEQQEKIDAKYQLIKDYLIELGGEIVKETKTICVANFKNSRGKVTFCIKITRHNLLYSKATKERQVYFQFLSSVIKTNTAEAA